LSKEVTDILTVVTVERTVFFNVMKRTVSPPSSGCAVSFHGFLFDPEGGGT
jgi:hypothetical protein